MITPARLEHLGLFFAIRLHQENVEYGYKDTQTGNSINRSEISHCSRPHALKYQEDNEKTRRKPQITPELEIGAFLVFSLTVSLFQPQPGCLKMAPLVLYITAAQHLPQYCQIPDHNTGYPLLPEGPKTCFPRTAEWFTWTAEQVGVNRPEKAPHRAMLLAADPRQVPRAVQIWHS